MEVNTEAVTVSVELTPKEAAVVRWYLGSLDDLGPNGTALLNALYAVDDLPSPFGSE